MIISKLQEFPKRVELANNAKERVVFLMGVYLHNPLNFMARRFIKKSLLGILDELDNQKPNGYLGYELAFGNPSLLVSYWDDYELLLNFARDKSAQHFPAWYAFNTTISSMKAVGLWHEIYKLQAGRYTGIYKNCPPSGMGKFAVVDALNGAHFS